MTLGPEFKIINQLGLVNIDSVDIGEVTIEILEKGCGDSGETKPEGTDLISYMNYSWI